MKALAATLLMVLSMFLGHLMGVSDGYHLAMQQIKDGTVPKQYRTECETKR